MFKTTIFAHFDRCDPAGILFYGNYAILGHQVLEQYIPALGISWSEWFENKNFGVPIRKLDVDYLRSIFAGRQYVALAQVGTVKNSSVEFVVEFAEPGGEICARINSIHVFVDLTTAKKMMIPPLIKELLQKGVHEGSKA